MRLAASAPQLFAVRWLPRAARTTRGPETGASDAEVSDAVVSDAVDSAMSVLLCDAGDVARLDEGGDGFHLQ